MPELPEVETVIREIRPRITGKKIEKLDVLWPKTFEHRFRIPLAGRTIVQVDRIGKYIILKLDKGNLIIHLRMSGQLLLNPAAIPAHLRVLMHMEGGLRMAFNDVRKFGRWYFVQSEKEVLKQIGMDALAPELTCTVFKKMLKKSGMGIKAFLLSQRFIAGLGNIYVDESLFRSRIHPLSVSAKLSAEAAGRLFAEIRKVLNFAIDQMGSTISDYRDANGKVGNAQNFFYVYQQQGRPCVTCGATILKQKISGRGTHFCPECQKLYGR